MYNDFPDILASRLNFDVVSFRGNTRKEMIVIGVGSFILVSFIFSIFFKLFLGLFLIGFGLSFPITIPVGWLVSTIIQKLKDGKPKGYVRQKLLIWFDTQGIKISPFVQYSGKWQVRR